MDRGMNMKPGINYCAPVGQLGFRGVADNVARLIPLAEESETLKEMFFFHGVDVSANQLPYLPEMGPGSAFEANGCWHHYKILGGLFIIHLSPNANVSSFRGSWVLQAVQFEGEDSPRIFCDQRNDLSAKGILRGDDLEKINKLLETKRIVLSP